MPPGMPRTEVNDAARVRMAALADFYNEGIEWLDLLRNPGQPDVQYAVSKGGDNQLLVTSGAWDMSYVFEVGRLLRLTDGGVPGADVRVASVSHSPPHTIVETRTTGPIVPAGTDGCLLHSIVALGELATLDSVPDNWIIPDGFTDADFAAALARIPAEGYTIFFPGGRYQLESEHDIPVGARLIGDGTKAVFEAEGLAVSYVLKLQGTCHIENILFEYGATGPTGHILFADAYLQYVSLKNVKIQSSAEDGIHFEAGARYVSMDNVIVNSPRGNGIYIADPDTNTESVHLYGCHVSSPGAFAAGFKTYGMWLQGQFEVAACSVTGLDGGGAHPQVGFHLHERVAIPPNEQDARFLSVVGCYVGGSGASSVGVEMDGRKCTFASGSIDLPGASSLGVQIGGTLGLQKADHNRITGNSIRAAVGVDQTNTNADANLITGNVFSGCATDVRISGTGTTVLGNVCDGSSSDSILLTSTASRARVVDNRLLAPGDGGIKVAAGADDVRVSDNHIYYAVGHGIEVEAANRVVITGNELDLAGGDGILIGAGATAVRVCGNHCEATAGVDYNNQAGAGTVFIDNYPLDQESVTNAAGATVGWVYQNIPFPAGDGGPDGVSRYVVTFDGRYEANSASGTGGKGVYTVFDIRLGATGLGGATQNSGKCGVYKDVGSTGFVNTQGAMCVVADVLPAVGDVIGVWATTTYVGAGTGTPTIAIADCRLTIKRKREE